MGHVLLYKHYPVTNEASITQSQMNGFNLQLIEDGLGVVFD